MTLQEIYELTNLKAIFSIDDEWKYNNSVEGFLFDLFRMNDFDVKCFFDEIKCHNEISDKIENAYNALKDGNFKIDEGKPINRVIFEDTDDKIKCLVDEISLEDLSDIREVSQRYGIELKERGSSSLEKVIYGIREKCHISFRIYNDFLSEDIEILEDEVNGLDDQDGYILFIVDDQLNGENRASEIIKWLEDSDFNSKLICVLLTSRDNSSNQKFSKNLYVEYVKKDDVQKNIKHFEKAYIKSLYRIMLYELQTAKTKAIEGVFKYAYENHNSAIFFSKMANEEGELNFDFILRWFSLKEKKFIEDEEKEIIKRIIVLSNTLNNLEPEEEMYEQDDAELYTFDVYDSMINYYCKPISAGDIFKIKDEYYILIGQECDLALRKNGTRKAEVFEFIKAEVKDWENDVMKEVKNGYEKVIINYFQEDGKKKYLFINCGNRYFGKADIFDMCSFNIEGKAQIDLEKELSLSIVGITTPGTVKLYNKIRGKLKSIIKVKNTLNDDKVFEEFGRTVALSSDKTEVVNSLGFSLNDGRVSYDVKRVCRLRKHFGLLQRLYLQYRGRQAEEAACFSRAEEIMFLINEKECRGRYFLSTSARKNQLENIIKLPWSVNVSDLKDVIPEEYKELNIITLDNSCGRAYGLRYSKKYDAERNKFILLIEPDI